MIVAIGIDLAEIARVRRVRERHPRRFDERVFTPSEREYCTAQADPAMHLAGRFAAKEAVLKVLGTGWGNSVAWREIEVVRIGLGELQVELHGVARDVARERGIERLTLSMTHTRDHAMAVAIGET